MPRLIREKHCPHCRHELGDPRPRVCPTCGGSLQQRYLRVGCLSSAPPLVAVVLGLRWLLEHLAGR